MSSIDPNTLIIAATAIAGAYAVLRRSSADTWRSVAEARLEELKVERAKHDIEKATASEQARQLEGEVKKLEGQISELRHRLDDANARPLALEALSIKIDQAVDEGRVRDEALTEAIREGFSALLQALREPQPN